MRKLILFFTLAAIAMMSGCDPSTSYYFEIKNDTESEMTVKIGDNKQITILSKDNKVVYSDSSLGVTDPFNYIILYKLNVIINGKLMSNNFWRKEYWEEKRGDTHHFTYTFPITYELIETLLSNSTTY